MRRHYITLAVIVVIVALALWMNLPGFPGIRVGDFYRSMQTVLGLDLKGGLQVLLEADIPANSVNPQDLDSAKQILTRRTNALGVSEINFQVAGANRIVGEFPGLSDPDRVIAVIKETGLLEFVDLQDQQLAEGTVIQTDLGQTTAQTQITPTVLPPTPTTASNSPTATPGGAPTPTPTAAPKVYHTLMTGTELKSVGVTTSTAASGFVISFTLSSKGAQIFKDYTTNNVGKFLAIVLDKKILSAPTIKNPITDGAGIIEGSFTNQTANDLAIQMRFGSLPFGLKVVETRVVGPTLGQDSLNKSINAGIAGVAIVLLFMAIFYRIPGVLADFSILIYALIVLSIYRLLPVTLTLPGIAGFLLSTGSALDANILIFERFKEELRNGRSFSQAIDLAWKHAWPSIRDSNLATLITCGILYLFGSSFGATIVLGFAVTLIIGVLVSLTCAYFVTLTFLRVLVDQGKPRPESIKWFGVLN